MAARIWRTKPSMPSTWTTGAIVAVTLQGADVGDTTTIIETAIAATEQVEDAQANVDDRQSLEDHGR